MTLDIIQLMTHVQDREYDETDHRILDAALEENAAQGVGNLSLERVAKRARMNRATIYRRFGNREGLQGALAVREGKQMARELRDAVEDIEDTDTVFIEGFVAAIRFAREHPVIARTAQYEPGELIMIGRVNNSALLQVGASFMANTIRWAQEKGRALHLDADSAGDLAARMFAAFVLIPGGYNQLTNDEAARDFAKKTFVPMFLGNSLSAE